ncbi:MAG TPA: aconitase family protein [Candidatus Baltobacteraceae bacterium]|nr:aconitase family protein [Candidatus Baltobacteraceae bacterium]
MGALIDPRKNYFDSVWDLHKLETVSDEIDLIFIDAVVVMDGPQEKKPAHPTYEARCMREWARYHDIRLVDGGERGIAGVLSTRPSPILAGNAVLSRDPRTACLGALGALPVGAGVTAQSGGLFSGCVVMERPLVMRVLLTGRLGKHVSAYDLALHAVCKVGTHGGVGFAIEFAGSLIRQLDIDQRLTLCEMAAETGAVAAIIAPDKKTAEFSGVQPSAPLTGIDPQCASYDRSVRVSANDVIPLITWGLSRADAISLDERVPRNANENVLSYMGLQQGQRLARLGVDRVEIGAPNMRLADLRFAASVLSGQRVRVPTAVLPRSEALRREAEKQKLHEVFLKAGASWAQALDEPGGRSEEPLRCVCTWAAPGTVQRADGLRIHVGSPSIALTSALLGRIPTLSEIYALKAHDISSSSEDSATL